VPQSQWRSVRTTNAIERLHEEFTPRIKTQTVLPSAAAAGMLFWAPLASGQSSMRKVDGWQTLAEKLIAQPIDLAAQWAPLREVDGYLACGGRRAPDRSRKTHQRASYELVSSTTNVF